MYFFCFPFTVPPKSSPDNKGFHACCLRKHQSSFLGIDNFGIDSLGSGLLFGHGGKNGVTVRIAEEGVAGDGQGVDGLDFNGLGSLDDGKAGITKGVAVRIGRVGISDGLGLFFFGALGGNQLRKGVRVVQVRVRKGGRFDFDRLDFLHFRHDFQRVGIGTQGAEKTN